MDITEDYKYILNDLSIHFNIPIKNIEIIEEDGKEWVGNRKTNEKYLFNNDFFVNKTSTNYKNPTNYIKILFEKERKSDFADAIFIKSKNDFLKLVKTDNDKIKKLIGEEFHWSEIMGMYDEVLTFLDEYEYWKNEKST